MGGDAWGRRDASWRCRAEPTQATTATDHQTEGWAAAPLPYRRFHPKLLWRSVAVAERPLRQRLGQRQLVSADLRGPRRLRPRVTSVVGAKPTVGASSVAVPCLKRTTPQRRDCPVPCSRIASSSTRERSTSRGCGTAMASMLWSAAPQHGRKCCLCSALARLLP